MIELNDDATIEDLHKILMSIIENKEPFTISHKGKLINFDKNKQSTLESFGITDLSTIQISYRIKGGGWSKLDLAQMPSVKEFIEKFEEQKPEKEEQYNSIKFYKTQSCHTPSKNDKPCEIAYEIDEDLEDDWIQNIKKSLNSISIHAPGIKFTKYSDVLDKIHPGGEILKQYRIKFKNIAENTTFTVGNIYNKDVWCISLSNDWENKRFRTALFNVLLSIGFVREHCRKDRDKYVNVYTSESQYKIEEDSNELTAFDPFSIMFYGEDKKNMKRVSNNGLFKLK